MQRGHGFRVRAFIFGTRRFGLANNAAILAVTEVGLDGTQSVENRTLSDFVLSLRFGTRRFCRSLILMRFGLVNNAAILAVTAVGVDGNHSVANWTLSDFVLFGVLMIGRSETASSNRPVSVSFPPDS